MGKGLEWVHPILCDFLVSGWPPLLTGVRSVAALSAVLDARDTAPHAGLFLPDTRREQ